MGLLNVIQKKKDDQQLTAEDLKFLLPNPNYNFRDYTIQEAINRTIDINCTAIITTS